MSTISDPDTATRLNAFYAKTAIDADAIEQPMDGYSLRGGRMLTTD
jgi:hypothetical protein